MKLLAHYQQGASQSRRQIVNWRENYLNDSFFYSLRSTRYDRDSYPSAPHWHDYYELVVFEEGEIQYLCEGRMLLPRCGDVVLIPPHRVHMSRIAADETLYTRHVFYLYPNAFEGLGCGELTGFLTAQGDEGRLLTVGAQGAQALLSLLYRLDDALQGEQDARTHALCLGLTLEIFYLLSGARPRENAGSGCLPENALRIQRYIGEHFAEIRSVSDVAAHFFYSREYVSRLFRQCFNTSPGDYLLKCRVAHSQSLISQGVSLSDACYQSGFGSMSTFIRAFRALTGRTPSQYRAESLE